jgi:flagellar hook protein FlgE
MWTKGNIDNYEFSAKVYDEGSVYGIKEGRISKLEIRRDGYVVANYDRGWDVQPLDEGTEAIVEELLHRYH